MYAAIGVGAILIIVLAFIAIRYFCNGKGKSCGGRSCFNSVAVTDPEQGYGEFAFQPRLEAAKHKGKELPEMI